MNTNKKSELADLLRQLADFIEARADEELIPLFQQAQRLVVRKATVRPAKISKPKIEEVHPAKIAEQLSMMSKREEGEALLLASISNRKGLESLARYLQLPVQRDDSVERLRIKIIESSIGARLRSDAIQGKGLSN
jgi:GTP cyclohydrolase FolE2